MARLHIMNLEAERRVEVVLSRRNLLSLLHKLDMPGSMGQIEGNDCYEDGVQTPFYIQGTGSATPWTKLVLRCEDDPEHYANRPVGPGGMHPATERFVAERGGVGAMQSAAPKDLPRTHLTFDDAREQIAGWHFNKTRLSVREQQILDVAEALLRALEQRPV